MRPRVPLVALVLLLPFAAPPADAARAARPARKRPPARPATPAPARETARLAALRVFPAVLRLEGKDAAQRLLVTGVTADGRQVDLTDAATYRSAQPRVAVAEPGGRVRSVGNGATAVEVRAGRLRARVPVRTVAADVERPVSFTYDVVPLLARAGCAQGACHAKQGGQNGFQLSVLSYDPESDYRAIVLQAGGRRLNRLEPGRSLLLLKATATLPHGGGRRIAPGSAEYRLLARWIAEGAVYARPGEPRLERLEIAPRERILAPPGSGSGARRQRLLVTAVYSDGSRKDVTGAAEFRSSEPAIAEVEGDGRVVPTGVPGEAAVMARYLDEVAVARFTMPLPHRASAGAQGAPRRNSPVRNFIDEAIYRKLERLGLVPSPLCDDATFLRRAFLDLIGTLPTPEEVRAFLAECRAETGGQAGRPAFRARARLVERLLERPEYADYWAMRWVNLLLVDRDPLFPKGAFAYDRWVREAFRQNMPFDRFAREIVTATGETYRDGPANFYRSLATPVEQAKAISQLFLGVRLDCAQCHHHPSERWSQDDFYGMAAFFARVRRKGATEFEQVVFVAPEGEVRHPKTQAVMRPKPPGGEAPPIAEDEDPREALARWMTAPDNPWFARTIANRAWGWLMGQGLVEPVDDFRASNPACNEELLDALAADFVAHGYDLKHLLRTIAASAAYQRSSVPTRENARDTRYGSRYLVKRLPAEVLLDAIGQVTGVPETFQGHPAGTRAIQLWDNKLPVEFLEVFGRPTRLSVCECDRPSEGSVTQVLHLMNSAAIQNRLTADTGRVAALAASGKPPEAIIEELYLAAYARLPQPRELEAARAAFARPGASRRAAIEDLLWALLNSPEFLFNH